MAWNLVKVHWTVIKWHLGLKGIWNVCIVWVLKSLVWQWILISWPHLSKLWSISWSMWKNIYMYIPNVLTLWPIFKDLKRLRVYANIFYVVCSIEQRLNLFFIFFFNSWNKTDNTILKGAATQFLLVLLKSSNLVLQ